MNNFETERKKYKPEEIKILLVAESPPKSDSKRFFYFENVEIQDSLFLETMKLLYPRETEGVEPRLIRKNKKTFLEKFKNDGFYLIDSLDKSFEKKYSSSKKMELIRKGQSILLNKINELVSHNTKVILISSSVFSVNFTYLKQNNINILNIESIDFPGSGGQKKFREKMRIILKR